MKSFNWSPVRGMDTVSKPRVKVVQFGDGYSQRAPNGINHVLKEFSPKFRYLDDEIDRIVNFFEEHGGYQAFLFTPPSKPIPVTVVCESWTQRRVSAKKSEVVCKFKQVPA